MKKIVAIIILSLAVYGCRDTPRPTLERIESLKVIVAKTTETVNATSLSSGYTTYKLAFNDGWTSKTSFGFYSCLQVGDTVKFTKLKDDSDYWLRMEPVCK